MSNAFALKAKFMRTCDSPTEHHYELRAEYQKEIEQAHRATLGGEFKKVYQCLDRAMNFLEELQVLEDVEGFLIETEPKVAQIHEILTQRLLYVRNCWNPPATLIKS